VTETSWVNNDGSTTTVIRTDLQNTWLAEEPDTDFYDWVESWVWIAENPHPNWLMLLSLPQ
jgi:hypothetical protein